MNSLYKKLIYWVFGVLITLIPTLVVLYYLLSLDTVDTISKPVNLLIFGPMCMAVGFMYLTIYVFIWSIPQEIEPAQLRIMRGILIAWLPFSLSMTIQFLGFAEYPAFLRIGICDLNILLIAGWLIWGYYNFSGYSHASLNSGIFLFAFAWLWIAYAIFMYGLLSYWLIPFLQYMSEGGN